MFSFNVFQYTLSTTHYLSKNVRGILHLNLPNSLIWKINSLPHCAKSNCMLRFVCYKFLLLCLTFLIYHTKGVLGTRMKSQHGWGSFWFPIFFWIVKYYVPKQNVLWLLRHLCISVQQSSWIKFLLLSSVRRVFLEILSSFKHLADGFFLNLLTKKTLHAQKLQDLG